MPKNKISIHCGWPVSKGREVQSPGNKPSAYCSLRSASQILVLSAGVPNQFLPYCAKLHKSIPGINLVITGTEKEQQGG